VTGFLVKAENPLQLAACLDQLLKSAELRRSMGKAAQQRAITHFCRERFISDFIRLLNDSDRCAQD
jgi:glycosyltransferase involved in cell wall biosynthesis